LIKRFNATAAAEWAEKWADKVQALSSEDLQKATEDPKNLTFLVMIFIATSAVYVGSQRSVRNNVRREAAGETPEEGEEEEREIVSTKQAAMMPIVGSCVLFGLYLAFQFIPKYIMNHVLCAGFNFIGVVSVAGQIRSILPDSRLWRIVAGLIAVGVIAAWYLTKHFITNNIVAFAVAVEAIEQVVIPDVGTAALALWGLFVYDIYWVFATGVMVDVARNVEVPAMFKLPANLFDYPYDPKRMSMLGLGDIVVPGLLVALCLRYDFSRHIKGNSPGRVSTPLFRVAVVTYIIGLFNSVFMMVFFEAAQPALLYLVPWCFFGVSLAATCCGGVGKFYAYSEAEEAKERAEKKEKKDEEEVEYSYGDLAYNFAAEIFGFEPRKPVPKAKKEN